VNAIMRSRKSSKPKLMLGSWSAIDSKSGRATLLEKVLPKRAWLGVSVTAAIVGVAMSIVIPFLSGSGF